MKKTLAVLALLLLAAPLVAQEIGAAIPVPLGVPEAGVTAYDAAADAAALPKPKDVVVKTLALTADQVTKWDALLAAQKDALEPLVAQLKADGEQLAALFGQVSPDPAAIGTLILKDKRIGEQMQAVHKDYVAGFEALLTVEQKGRLGLVRAADKLQPVLPAFRLFGLLLPPARS
jgi:hypothetical protein